jgi:hypothetical protein
MSVNSHQQMLSESLREVGHDHPGLIFSLFRVSKAATACSVAAGRSLGVFRNCS